MKSTRIPNFLRAPVISCFPDRVSLSIILVNAEDIVPLGDNSTLRCAGMAYLGTQSREDDSRTSNLDKLDNVEW